MTIEECIDILDDNFTVLNTHGHYAEKEEAKAIEMAIASLEAWGEVKQDIKQLADYDTVDILVDVLRIINKHMQEVTP